MKPYLALIRNEIRLAYRQKAVLFFNYFMPLAFFFVFAQIGHAGGKSKDAWDITPIVTMVLVIGILANGLFGGGMRTVQDRESNILRRYKVAPISPLPLLVASTVTGLLIYLPLLFGVVALAQTKYGMPAPADPLSLLLFAMLSVIALRSIGLIIASVVNSVQESNVLVQTCYLGMLFLSGATFPIALFPPWLKVVSRFIPATHLVEGMQNILGHKQSIAANWEAAFAMVLTTAVGLFICVKLFRWEKEEKIRPAAKLWLVAVLLPFLLLGAWQATQPQIVTAAPGQSDKTAQRE